MKRLAALLFLISSTLMFAQTQIDPTYQIAWNLLTGSGAPSISCTQNGNYTVYPYGAEWGQSYQDTTNNVQYNCTSTGWALIGGLPSGCSSPSTGSISCSGTVAAGAATLTVPTQPSTAPTASVGAAGVLTGSYVYAVTFNNAVGAGYLNVNQFSSAVTPSSQRVNLSNLPISVDPAVTSRTICRGGSASDPNGGAVMYLVAVLGNNTATTYTDNISDASLTTFCPWQPTGAVINIPGLGPTYSSGYSSFAAGNMAGPVGGAYASTFINQCGYGVVGATHNVCVGTFALSSSLGVGSNGNTAVGVHALGALAGTGNSQNSAYGFGALENQAGGGATTCFGALCFPGVTNGEGSTGLGYYAGAVDSFNGAVTLCYGCTMLGNSTRPFGSGDVSETAIGNNSIGHGSNTFTLGDTATTDVYSGGWNGTLAVHHAKAFFASGDPGGYGTQGGSWIVWNHTAGMGETDFINSYGSGAGGWNFYKQASGSAAVLIGSIDASGSMSSFTWAGQPITTTYGGLGADNHLANGVPVFVSGAATVTGQVGISGGAPVKATNTYGCTDGYDHLPCIVAVANQSGKTANITGTTLYTPGAGQAGTYRLSCYVVVTTAATTSSTLPQCQAVFTDSDTSTANVTLYFGNPNSANTVGSTGTSNTNSSATNTMQVKASTAIQYYTNGYVTSGATPMAYAIHVKLEYLGQ